MLRSSLALVLALSLFAPVAAQAATPHSILVDITWSGKGKMGRDWQQKIDGGRCTLDTHAVDQSTFTWTSKWNNVRLKIDRDVVVSRREARDQNPTGRLGGKYTVETHFVNGCDPNSPPENCSKTYSFSSRGYDDDSTLEVTRIKKGKVRYQFFVDAQTGVGAKEACPNDAPFGGKVGGYYWTNYSVTPPNPIELGALSAYTFIPASTLLNYGKVVDLITSKQMNAPPALDYDCAAPGSGAICAVQQNWHGTLTIQRVRK